MIAFKAMSIQSCSSSPFLILRLCTSLFIYMISYSNCYLCRIQFSNCSFNWHFLPQVRRGVDKADIYSIALSPNMQWLAVSSDKGTVHIFSLRVRVVGEHQSIDSTAAKGPALFNQNSSNSLDPLISQSTGSNPGSSLSFMKGEAIPYLKFCYSLHLKWIGFLR